MGAAGERIDLRARERAAKAVERIGTRACHQEAFSASGDAVRDGDDLLGGLALPQDDFGLPLPESAVVIDRRERQRLDRISRKPVECRVDVELTVRDLTQQRQHTVADHASAGSSSVVSTPSNRSLAPDRSLSQRR